MNVLVFKFLYLVEEITKQRNRYIIKIIVSFHTSINSINSKLPIPQSSSKLYLVSISVTTAAPTNNGTKAPGTKPITKILLTGN